MLQKCHTPHIMYTVMYLYQEQFTYDNENVIGKNWKRNTYQATFMEKFNLKIFFLKKNQITKN